MLGQATSHYSNRHGVRARPADLLIWLVAPMRRSDFSVPFIIPPMVYNESLVTFSTSFYYAFGLRSTVHWSSSCSLSYQPKYAISIETYSVPSPTEWQEVMITIGSNTIAMILQWLLPSFSSFCSLQQQSCISISSFERRHGLLFLYLSEASVHHPIRGIIVAEHANVFA